MKVLIFLVLFAGSNAVLAQCPGLASGAYNCIESSEASGSTTRFILEVENGTVANVPAISITTPDGANSTLVCESKESHNVICDSNQRKDPAVAEYCEKELQDQEMLMKSHSQVTKTSVISDMQISTRKAGSNSAWSEMVSVFVQLADVKSSEFNLKIQMKSPDQTQAMSAACTAL